MTRTTHVTAVLVSHNGAAYLPRVLRNLADQTRPPDRRIGIDAGSWDGSAAQLEDALTPPCVLRIGNRRSFGAAIKNGLAQLAPTADNPSDEYLWFIHDDSAPDTTALAELLAAVETAPSVTIAGCKNVTWGHEKTLVDVGLEASRTGERLTMVEPDEHDQGQYDNRSDMLAVNSAGMLIRRDVWDELRGFDPALPGPGDDIDLCWRNWAAGHRTIVVPAARIRHFRHRPQGLASPAATKTAHIYTRLKHCPSWQVPFLWLSSLIGGLGHILLSVLCKIPGAGWEQLFATLKALSRIGALIRGRRNARRTRTLSRSVIRPLLVPLREARTHQRSVGEALLGHQEPSSAPQAAAATPSADDDVPALETPHKRHVAGLTIALTLLTLTALVGFSRLLGSPALEGGALRPVASSLATLWRHTTSWWTDAGAGGPGASPPFAGILFLLGLLGLTDANAGIVWLTFLSLPLAAAGAWFCAGALGAHHWPKTLAALLWGASPVLLTSIDNGRLPTLIVHLVLPWIVLGVLRTLRTSASPPARPNEPSAPVRLPWTAAAATSLLVALLLACAPTLAPLVFLGVVLLVLRTRGRVRVLWWLLIPTIVTWAPYLLTHLDDPRTLLGDPGLLSPSPPAPSWQHLLGFPQALSSTPPPALNWLPPGQPWGQLVTLVIGGPTLLVALTALIWPHARSSRVRSLWLLAFGALATAYATTWITTGISGAQTVTPYAGPAVSTAALALLLAAVVGLGQLRGATGGADTRPLRRLLAAVAVTLLFVAPIASAGIWVSSNLTQGSALQRSDKLLPATASDGGLSPARSRTLVLTADRGDRGVNAQLMRSEGNTLDALTPALYTQQLAGPLTHPTRAPDQPPEAAVRTVAMMIAATTGADPRPILESLGVGFVLLRLQGEGIDALAERINSVPGLSPVGQTDVGWLWRITPPIADGESETVGAARLSSKGKTLAYIPLASDIRIETTIQAGADRTLILAERADPGWNAWVDGRPLERAPAPEDAPWAQAFTLPPDGGRLEVRYEQPWAPWFFAVQLAVLILTLLMSVPVPAARHYVARTLARGFHRKELLP